MLKFEDYFDSNTSGIMPLDFETFIEGAIRNQPERDYRDFEYHSEILRPRHIVETYKCLEQHGFDNLFMATAPTIQFKGQQYHAEVVTFNTFVDFLKGLTDLLSLPDTMLLLNSVRRRTSYNNATFVDYLLFQLSVIKIPY